jgi:hypothetical protein
MEQITECCALFGRSPLLFLYHLQLNWKLHTVHRLQQHDFSSEQGYYLEIRAWDLLFPELRRAEVARTQRCYLVTRDPDSRTWIGSIKSY